jgi:hypothetical protein
VDANRLCSEHVSGGGLMLINRSTMTYQSRRDPQDALRMRLHKLAASRVRFGDRRLTVMLRRRKPRPDAGFVHRRLSDSMWYQRVSGTLSAAFHVGNTGSK